MPYLTQKAVIIGAGNVAWHLVEALEAIGIPVEKVYSRTLENAQLLAKRSFRAIPTNDLDFSDSQADLFFICVPDQAIVSVVSQIKIPPHAMLIHTSGSISMQVLINAANDVGVLYPLQSFSKQQKIDWKKIPIFLEANHSESLDKLFHLAEQISENIFEINSEERLQLHIAAVFANNFVNHLLWIAEKQFKKMQLPFHLLKPLIEETLQKAFRIGAYAAQTGPARRKDHDTLAQHIEILLQQGNHKEAKIYELISQNIVATYFPDHEIFL